MRVLLFALLILPYTVNSSIFGNLFNSPTPKDKCPIQLYDPKDPSFTGFKVYANEDFHSLLVTLSKYAKECQVKIQVKQSFMQENPGLEHSKIHDRTEMAFRLGEAIEFELVDQDKKLLCNQICLKKPLSSLEGLPSAKCFLEKVDKNSAIRQDALKPYLLIKQHKPLQKMVKLEEIREKIREKCSKLKISA